MRPDPKRSSPCASSRRSPRCRGSRSGQWKAPEPSWRSASASPTTTRRPRRRSRTWARSRPPTASGSPTSCGPGSRSRTAASSTTATPAAAASAAPPCGSARATSTFAATPFPDVRPKPEQGDGWVRFVQSAGGRTGAPAPRRIRRPPFVQMVAPAAWSTLALTIHTDGRADYEVVGASPFPRHWIYDARGHAGRQDGPHRLRAAGSARPRSQAHPVGRRGLAGAGGGRRDGPGAAAVGGHHRRRPGVPHGSRQGETLVEQGDVGNDVYLLFDGVLMVEIDGKPVAELGPGRRGRRDGPARGEPAHGHPAGGHPLPDRRGRRRPARPGRPRGGGTGPPRTGRLT